MQLKSKPTAQQRVDRIKAAGARKELHDGVRSALWRARCSIEEAGKDAFKDYKKSVAEARKELDDADLLYNAADLM